MKKYLFPVVALIATMASCTSDVEDATVAEQNAKEQLYTIASKPFEFVDDLTRVYFTLVESRGLNFHWDYKETFGVYPLAPYENTQAAWNLERADREGCNEIEDSAHFANHYDEVDNVAIFDGRGWQLRQNAKYAAYHPYNGNIPSNTPYTKVPVSMPTTQDGTLGYIGDNVDFMCTTGTYERPDINGHTSKVVFDFNHSIAIVQIQVPVPNSGIDGIIVEAKSGEPFITEGTWNVATGAVTATSTTNRITLNNYETLENGIATYYLAAFPTTTGECDIKVKTSGVTMNNTVSSKKLEAGKAYRWIL